MDTWQMLRAYAIQYIVELGEIEFQAWTDICDMTLASTLATRVSSSCSSMFKRQVS